MQKLKTFLNQPSQIDHFVEDFLLTGEDIARAD
jgi:hypothetical protein